MAARFLTGLCALLLSAAAHADTIKVLSADEMREVISELQSPFEAASGHTLVITWAGTSKVKELVSQQPYDLVIVGAPEIDVFMLQGKVKLGSRVDLAKFVGGGTLSSGILATSGHVDRARVLQTYLAGSQAAPVLRKHRMEPAR